MNSILSQTIDKIKVYTISEERQMILQSLIDFIQQKVNRKEDTNINFICTHNSRRSHLSQVWAQVASTYFGIPGIVCYSGGTEETALFPKIREILLNQGFDVIQISSGHNPIYAIKFAKNSSPIISFSKTYDHPINPSSEFIAILTCSQVDSDCPFVAGAVKRIPITYEDPKISDDSPTQTQVYTERSLQIAAEFFYVFSQIKK